MTEKFAWKGEITFSGTAKEFAALTKAISGMVEVDVSWPSHGLPKPFPGYPPWQWWQRVPEASVNKLIEGGQKIQAAWVKDIPGGIRDPHLHLADGIVLLNRDQFKMMVREVASTLAAESVDRQDDFVAVMTAIQTLAATPIEIP